MILGSCTAGKILLQQRRQGGILRPLSPAEFHHAAASRVPMPTYDYECQTCGHQFEARQSMKDPHLTECPQSGCVGPVKRKIGVGAGFIFKGNGFYITDYRSDSYKAAAKKDSESSATSASTASTTASSGGGSSSSTASAPAPAKAGTAT